jgi:hypothetical protein
MLGEPGTAAFNNSRRVPFGLCWVYPNNLVKRHFPDTVIAACSQGFVDA